MFSDFHKVRNVPISGSYFEAQTRLVGQIKFFKSNSSPFEGISPLHLRKGTFPIAF